MSSLVLLLALVLATAYAAHVTHAAGTNFTTTNMVATDISRCYRFDVTDKFCPSLAEFDQRVAQWRRKRDLLRDLFSSYELIDLFEEHMDLVTPEEVRVEAGHLSNRGADWLLQKITAARPDITVIDWNADKHYKIIAHYPVNTTVLAAVTPCDYMFVERWTDAEAKIFERYGFTDWHYTRVPCPVKR